MQNVNAFVFVTLYRTFNAARSVLQPLHTGTRRAGSRQTASVPHFDVAAFVLQLEKNQAIPHRCYIEFKLKTWRMFFSRFSFS